MKLILRILTILASFSAAADNTKELELPLMTKVFTKESIVELSGMTYRKVEYKGDLFYLQLNTPHADSNSFAVFCSEPKSGMPQPPIVRVGIQVLERTSFFVEALKLSCGKKIPTATQQQELLTLLPYLAVGFELDTKNDRKSFFKKKTISFTPGGIIFGAELD